MSEIPNVVYLSFFLIWAVLTDEADEGLDFSVF